MRWQVCVALGLLALPFLSACTGKSDEPTKPVSSVNWSDGRRIVQQAPRLPSDQVAEVEGAQKVRVTDHGFEPSQMRAAVGSRVKIYLTNYGIREHNMVIPRFGIVTQPLARGADTYIEFTASAKGTWPFFSDAPGAQERGFTGQLIVE